MSWAYITITIKCFFKRGKYSVIILAEVARGFEVLSVQIWAKILGTQRVFGTFCTPPTTFFEQLPESWTNFCPNWTIGGPAATECSWRITWTRSMHHFHRRLKLVTRNLFSSVGLCVGRVDDRSGFGFSVTHPQLFSSQVPKYVNWSLAPVFNRPVKMLNDHLLPKYPLVTAKTCLSLLS